MKHHEVKWHVSKALLSWHIALRALVQQTRDTPQYPLNNIIVYIPHSINMYRDN